MEHVGSVGLCAVILMSCIAIWSLAQCGRYRCRNVPLGLGTTCWAARVAPQRGVTWQGNLHFGGALIGVARACGKVGSDAFSGHRRKESHDQRPRQKSSRHAVLPRAVAHCRGRRTVPAPARSAQAGRGAGRHFGRRRRLRAGARRRPSGARETGRATGAGSCGAWARCACGRSLNQATRVVTRSATRASSGGATARGGYRVRKMRARWPGHGGELRFPVRAQCRVLACRPSAIVGAIPARSASGRRRSVQ